MSAECPGRSGSQTGSSLLARGHPTARLCPRETLDNAKTPAESEACFQSHALDFANNGTVMFRWRGDPSTDYAFQGTVVTGDMVVPKGSMWMRNPVPRSNHNDPQTGKGYPAYCPNTNDQPCVGAQNGATSPAAILEIIDHVVIPADLKPGQVASSPCVDLIVLLYFFCTAKQDRNII